MSIGFINGEFVPIDQLVIPIDERGHQFGDGVYEVIRVYKGKPFMLAEHLERLKQSADAIRLKSRYCFDQIGEFIKQGIEKSGLADQDAQVYLQLTRGIAPRQHLFPNVPSSLTMTIRPATILPEHLRKEGATAMSLPDERWANCYIKSLNLLPNILAKQTAHDAGYYEAILYKDGYVTEGSSSNVFMVKDGNIYTTPLTKQILPGITRHVVQNLANSLSIPFEEKHFSVEELKGADEVFITSTVAEVLPIVKVDDTKIGAGTPGAITNQLYAEFKKLV